MFMKHHKEFYENVSTLVNQKQKGNTFNYADTYRKLSLYENKISSLNAELQLLKKENPLLHDKLQMNQVNLSKISSLNAELDLLKKEHTLLHDQLQMNQFNLSDNKEITSIKEDTHELKKFISIIKGEVHNMKNILLNKKK